MKKLFVVFVVLLGLGAPVAAQQPCGDNIPCKPVVWPLPNFPELTSPTPLATAYNPSLPTAVPSNTPTWTPYPTGSPYPTWTPFLDTAPISNQVQTVQALINGTDVPILNASGTPVTLGTQVANIGSNTSTFVGYMRTVQQSDVAGPFGPLLTMLFAGILIVFLLKAADYIVPLVIGLFGLIRKVVTLILEFLPF